MIFVVGWVRNCSFDSECGLFVYFHAIYLDASVGAYPGARAAAGAAVGVGHIGEVVSAVVHFVGLKRQSIGRAGDHTKIASLASFDVDGNCSFYFCHCQEYCFKFQLVQGIDSVEPAGAWAET